MVFQWYLFVLLIIVATFARTSGQIYTVKVNGIREERYRWLPVLMVAIPLIYLSGTRANIGDTGAYRTAFLRLSASLSSLPTLVVDSTKDKGFTVFNVLVKLLIGNNDTLYFLIIATICLMCVVITYKKYSCNFIMSMFLFIASSDYVQWTYNGMRQFIAVSLIFAGTDWLLKKKYIPYIALILLASTIHATALLMIPICFIVQGEPWNKKTVFFTFAVLVAISSVDQLTNIITNIMENSQYAGEVDQYLETRGTNMLRVLVFAVPPLLALMFRKRIKHANNKMINISVGMSIVSMGAYVISAFTSGIFIGRVPIYFSLYNYILLPWIIENVFDKKSAKMIYIALIACYVVFYYYQMEIIWKF